MGPLLNRRMAVLAVALIGGLTLAACGSSAPDVSKMTPKEILRLASTNVSKQSMVHTAGHSADYPSYSVSSWNNGDLDGTYMLSSGGQLSVRKVGSDTFLMLNATALTSSLAWIQTHVINNLPLSAEQKTQVQTQSPSIVAKASDKWFQIPSTGLATGALSFLNVLPTKYTQALASASNSKVCNFLCAVTQTGTSSVNGTSTVLILFQVPEVPATLFQIASKGTALPLGYTVYSSSDPATSKVIWQPTLSWPNDANPSAPTTSSKSWCDLLTSQQYLVTNLLAKHLTFIPTCPAAA